MSGHWRDKQEWDRLGLPMSTPSNEACKMYDATLKQYSRSGEDETIGGFKATIENMLSADPEFVMGHVITNGLSLVGSGVNPTRQVEYKQRLDNLAKLAARPEVNEREKLHVKALQLNADGYVKDANAVWETILLKYPLDLLALRFAYVNYIFLGTGVEMRDSVARVFPHWKPDMPHYSCLFGMHGFALNETNLYQEAEKKCRKGLELDPNDGWATHALAHVLEMQGRQDEGISFMESTVKEWEPANMIACHNYWHWAVFHVEKGDYQTAMDIFDAEVGRRTLANNVFFNLQDATSLLFRLELEGVNVGDRWQALFEKARFHIDDNILAFGDPHTLMACLGAGQEETVQKMMDGMDGYIQNGNDTYTDVTKMVGKSLCQSLIAYNDGDYETAVNLLYPKRYLVHLIGGSIAQRDVFNLLLIQACIRSASTEHHMLARQLLNERKAVKEQAPMTDRLMAKALALPV